MSELGIRIEGLRKRYGEGDTAKGHYFPGFTVDVTTVFALGAVR